MDKHTLQPNPHTGHGFPKPTVPHDPILRSNRLSLLFPHEAAGTLGANRGAHCHVNELAIAAAQQRMYLMASMMGIWDLLDDPPTAA
jgi:hypothetical protein